MAGHPYHCLEETGDLNPGPCRILEPPNSLSGEYLVPVGSCPVFSLFSLEYDVYEQSGLGTK